MFNKKKKDNERPHYKDYQNTSNGFKTYIADAVLFLRSQGNKDAKAFDLDGFLEAVPDEVTPENLSAASDAAPYISDLIRKMGWEIFGDMLTNVGLSKETVDMFMDDDFKGLNTTGKNIPGLSSGDDSRAAHVRAKAIYAGILHKLSNRIIEATSKNDPSVLNDTIETLQRVQNDTSDMNVSQIARDHIQNLLDATLVFQELIDNEQTTPEEYNSFLNNMINHFIHDQVTETNENVIGEHTDHDPEHCDLTIYENDGPLQIVYRRFFNEDEEDPAIPGLHLIILDTARGVVHPVAISLHEALTPIAEKKFISDCKSEEGSNFIGNQVVAFIKDNEKLVGAMISKEEIDEETTAAVLRVSPEVVSPTAHMLRDVLAETRTTFNVNTSEVFSEIKPEDFFS